MFGFLFSKNPDSVAELLIDIGSKNVSGGIFEKTTKGRAKLLYTAQEPIEFQAQLTGDKLSVLMHQALGNLLLHLEKYGANHLRTASGKKYRINSAAIIISSPWHFSETKTLTANFNKPTVISKNIISGILAEEEKTFERSLSNDPQTLKDFYVLERKVVEMRLNGYPSSIPYGKEANILEVRLFNSVVSIKDLEKIERLISRNFHIERFMFHTFSIASFISLRDAFPEAEDFLIVQIGGEVTDIIIVKKGGIAKTISFPVGHNGLLRSLGKICSNHPDCSLEALLKLANASNSTDDDRQKVQYAINDTKKQWLENFNRVISDFSKEAQLPNRIFLFEEQIYSSLFEGFLNETVSEKLEIMHDPFAITVIDQEVSKKFCDTETNVIVNPTLSMEAGFSVKLGQQNFFGG